MTTQGFPLVLEFLSNTQKDFNFIIFLTLNWLHCYFSAFNYSAMWLWYSDGFSAMVTLTDACYVRALYDYEGTTHEELSFAEGTIIKIIRKDENGIDDGFWEGEVNGMVGVFPSLVVEELSSTGTAQVCTKDFYSKKE